MKKMRWRPAHTEDEHVHVEQSEGNAGGTGDCKGLLSPFLRGSPETVDVHEGPQDHVTRRREMTSP